MLHSDQWQSQRADLITGSEPNGRDGRRSRLVINAGS
jgi:hypothetical protein